MIKTQSLILACACLMLIGGSNVYAGDKPNSLSFTLGGGYDFFSPRRHIDDAGVGFFGVGYNFTSHWGIEGLVGFFESHFKKPYVDKKKTNGNLYLLNGVYNFLPSPFVEPFIVAGIGLTGFSSNRTDANNQGNVNIGAGIKFFVDEVVSLRAEAREIYSLVGGKSDILVDGGITFYLDCVRWS